MSIRYGIVLTVGILLGGGASQVLGWQAGANELKAQARDMADASREVSNRKSWKPKKRLPSPEILENQVEKQYPPEKESTISQALAEADLADSLTLQSDKKTKGPVATPLTDSYQSKKSFPLESAENTSSSPSPILCQQGLKFELLPTIYFDQDSTLFTQQNMKHLDSLARQLKKDNSGQLRVIIQAYADPREDKQKKPHALAKQRGQVVAQYLQNKGVSSRQISVRNYADRELVNVSYLPDTEPDNRRVEMRLVGHHCTKNVFYPVLSSISLLPVTQP